MIKSLSDIQTELMGIFFEESQEGLQQLETGLLALEQAEIADLDTINDVFRAVHSIKGGAGSFRLNEISSLSHSMESVLEDFRSQRAIPTRETLAVLLEGVDWLRNALDATMAKRPLPSDGIQAFCEQLEKTRTSSATPVAAQSAAKRGPSVALGVDFLPSSRILDSGNEPARLLRELARLGNATVTADLSKLPPLADIDASSCYLSWHVDVEGSDVSTKAVEEIFSWVDGEAELRVTPMISPPSPEPPVDGAALEVGNAPVAHPAVQEPRAPAGGAPEARSDHGIGSIRVGVDKIDLLMNMVGELVITQSMLGVIDDESRLDSRRVAQLREGLGLLARNTRSLQESVMRLRSVPISVVFNRFPRLVHDLAQQLGKRVELKVNGQATEIDKTVVEKLGDPLVHLVRNSLDHGLESPEVRRAAGKPETGVVQISAYHHGGDVVVEVRDDGRGIDQELVIARARKLGLLGETESAPVNAIREFIFAPGFSTAEKVTDVSGRGVGMDVVRRNVRALGGDVLVETAVGKGTTITMRLPLTLAIIDGQLIRVGSHAYVVPLLSIIESVQVDPKRVSKFQGKRDLYRLRDKLIPMIELGQVLGLQSCTRCDESLMMIVEADNAPVGLLVDELLAQQQVVVKSLETNYDRVAGLSGATILGDGSVALILDTTAIGRLVRGVPKGARAA